MIFTWHASKYVGGNHRPLRFRIALVLLSAACVLTSAPIHTQGETRTKEKETANKVEVLVKSRKFKKEGNALRVNFDDLDLLKVLNMEPVTPDAPKLMPEWLKDLDGKVIRVRGFMYPQFQEEGIPYFVMARDNEICCFGRSPKIYDLVEVSMKKGKTTHYIQNRPFDVVGTFRIKLGQLEETGEIFQLYHIDDAIVVEK